MTGRVRGRGRGRRGGGFPKSDNKKRSSAADDDPAPLTSKRAKTAEEEDDGQPLVPKLETDSEGNSYVALKANGMRRVTVSDFKGKTLVSIREYWTNDADEVLPGKKGISLSMDQYNTLIAAAPLIESVLTKKGEEAARPEYDGQTAEVAEQNRDEEEADPAANGQEDEDEEE
ncbi:PC4-domain-containing protein [Lojkania enalia]|uniref:PC4-domain-containing protein n=1 Tax=Lojkania enalia TaxID=147567 RepID=A0A9P4N307_9PLEO|nr:PC4-domain-containing protein [Didymosphaeria enalia]